ncbi:hypothetical protein DF185_07975 [Marinifilum breve]|uniref:Toxin-antitoxin system YwqK family antitoxin n=1 Tax=Marinifilum breve TaxID=2184082 RepID=A0A2V3ZYR0_9BACT|nr:hypothetical protein [Marinifilum breve]PXY01413.1 hypothetical protein DF185_07975 [Marinifilum breve]
MKTRQDIYNETPIETYNGKEYKVRRSYHRRTNQLKMESYYGLSNKNLLGALIVNEFYPSGVLKRYAELYKNGNLKHVIDYSENGSIIADLLFESNGQPIKKNPTMIEIN